MEEYIYGSATLQQELFILLPVTNSSESALAEKLKKVHTKVALMKTHYFIFKILQVLLIRFTISDTLYFLCEI